MPRVAYQRIGTLALGLGNSDLISLAVEDRFKVIGLLSAGLGGSEALPEADPVNFAPYSRPFRLMIHGRPQSPNSDSDRPTDLVPPW
jgi:hypothetical protein